jgi:hypothetical protein
MMQGSSLVISTGDRYDWTARKSLLRGYFLWSTVGYGLGLFLTYVALNAMDGSGQPALLYIVPCTLGTSLGDPFFCFWLLFFLKFKIFFFPLEAWFSRMTEAVLVSLQMFCDFCSGLWQVTGIGCLFQLLIAAHLCVNRDRVGTWVVARRIEIFVV